MSDHTGIQWTDATWNPVLGCTRVSAGCDHCYAAQLAATRLKHTSQHQGLAVITPSGRAAFNGTIRLLPERLDQPLRWRKPRRIFVNSLSDMFHEGIPDDYVRRVFDVMSRARRHTFQVLSKRPQRMAELVPLFAAEHTAADGSGWPLPNVQLGVSTEDQATADERIPFLLATPAAVRFISAEPLLGPIELVRGGGEYLDYLRGRATEGTGEYAEARDTAHLDWLIVGGESGPGARPMELAWARSIVEQCRAAGVAVFVKQLGRYPVERTDGVVTWPLLPLRDRHGGDPDEWPEDMRVREFPR